MSRLWALALVAACSVAFHVKGLSAPPLDYHFHRQVNTAAIARNYYEHGRHFFYPQVDWEGPGSGRAATEFPLYMWLMGVLWPIFGLGAVWGRVLSVDFSALGAVYLYLFLERKLSPREALASTLLYCAIPVQVYFGRTIQPEGLAMAASMAALYHWDRFLDEASDLHWALAIVAAFLAVAHKLPYIYLLLVLAAMAYLKRGWAAFKEHAVLVAPVLCCAAVYSWYRYASSGVYVVPAHASEFFEMLEYGKLLYYVQFQFVSRLPELCATWPGMALALAGAAWLWRRGQKLFFWWWGAVAAHLVAGGGYSFHHEYTALPFAPVMAAFMGTGLIGAWDRAKASARPAAAQAALAAVVLAIPVTGYFRIKHWYNQNFPFLAGAARAADAVSGPYDLFVTNQRASSVYLYYMHRRGWSWNLGETGQAGLDWIPEKAKQGARFYMTAAADLTPEMRAWIEARYPRVYDADGISIYRIDGQVPAVDLLGLGARPRARR